MPEDKKTIVKMAHIYTQEGRWDKAIAEYKKLIDLEPEDFNSYLMLGDVYIKKNDFQAAFDAYLICSDAYLRLGQLEKAGQAQGKIAWLNPESLNAESRKKQEIFKKQMEGDRVLDGGEPDKAVAAYQAVLVMDPDRFDLYQKLGDLFLRQGDTAAACAKYKELGDIYLKHKLMKKALPLFQKIVELEPENMDAHAALAEIHAKNGNDSDAKKETLLLAEALFQRGDLDGAFQFAKKAEDLKAIESYNYLGHVELRRGKRVEARGWFEKLLKFKLSHGGALWGMGVVHAQEGRADEALKTLAKVAQTDRFYGEALAATADIEAAQDKAEASQHYRDAAGILKAKGALALAKAAEDAASALAIRLGLENAPEPPAGAEAAGLPVEIPVAPAGLPAAVPAVEAASPSPPEAGLPLTPELEQALAPKASGEQVDGAESLIALAENFEAEGSLDEALGLYQRVLDLDSNHAAAKEGMSRVYRLLAGAVPLPQPAPAAPSVAPTAPGPGPDELAKLAALKAQAEAAQRQVQADAEARRILREREQAEAEARQKSLEEARFRDDTEAKLKAEIAALKATEAEAKRRDLEAEEQALAAKKRMEAEIRAQIEGEMRKQAEVELKRAEEEKVKRAEEETHKRAEEAARKRLEEETRLREADQEARRRAEEEAARRKAELDRAKLRFQLPQQSQPLRKPDAEGAVAAPAAKQSDELSRRQAEVLARVQDQQKSRQEAPLRRAIEEIQTRRKVGELADSAPAAKAEEAPAPPARAAGEDSDELEDFMTIAVADIYVKQGLKTDAQNIYERILKREPGNGDVRAKLEALLGHKTESPAGPKKSKVSYL